MDPKLAHECNCLNLQAAARFFECDSDRLIGFYDELLGDAEFLEALNERIRWARDEVGFHKALFAKGPVNSIDWFAFERIFIYVAIRHLQPKRLLETGVFYGCNTVFALQAVHRNAIGAVVSVDYPAAMIDAKETRHSLVGDSENLPPALSPGFLVPEHLRRNWDLRLGDALQIIPQLPGAFDFYIHDSEHSMKFVFSEMEAVWAKRTDDLFCIVDDVDWSNGFFAFCVRNKLYPFMFTDNGKDGLRVRGGAAWVRHPSNADPAFTG